MGRYEHATGEIEWYTPPEIVDIARSIMGGIDLDPSSCKIANDTVKASSFYSKEDVGVLMPMMEWGGRVFLNPPYSRELFPKFVEKLLYELDAGRTTQAILVCNNNTDTKAGQSLLKRCVSVCFTSGRISFIRSGVSQKPQTGQMILGFKVDPFKFKRGYRELGHVFMTSEPDL